MKTVEYKKQDIFFNELRKMETGSGEQKEAMRDYLKKLPDDKAREIAHWRIREGGFDTTGVRKSGDMLRLEPAYNKAQKLLDEGKKAEATAYYKTLSKEDRKIYQKIKTSERSKMTREFKELLEEDPKEAVEFLRSQRKDHQNRIYKNMSKKEKARYQTGKPENN